MLAYFLMDRTLLQFLKINNMKANPIFIFCLNEKETIKLRNIN